MKALLLTLTALTLLTLPAHAQIQQLNAWWTSTGETDSTWLGLSLANLGDVNGDGFADFCAGGETNTVYVYYGSAQPDSNFVYTFHPPGDSTTNFGYRMHNIGDVNGDGGVDLLVQSRIPSRNLHYCCYLYFGGTAFDTIPDLVFDGGEINPGTSGFGYDAGAIGDFNGDGGNDFVIGDGGVEIQPYPNLITGKMYLYFGGILLDSIPDLTMIANEQFDRLGGEFAEMGDIDADSFDDFLMGAGNCSNGKGVIMVFRGGNPTYLTPYWFQYGDTTNSGLGSSVTGVDFNHDGEKDLIVKNRYNQPPYTPTEIFIYWGSTQISNTPDMIFTSQYYEGYGGYLSGSDLNSDGYEDIISCVSSFNWGKAFVWLGGQYADTLLDAYYTTSGYEAAFGTSHITCDVNGDGIDDLVIGEPGYYFYNYMKRKGRVHVILGDTSLHQSVAVKPEPPILPIDPKLAIKTYPNPFNSNINFELNWLGTEIPTLEIYDLTGKKIKTITLKLNMKEATWDGTTDIGITCNSGIYFVKLSNKTQSVCKKIALVK
ncbi:MAG: FG-GAP-like repeat-containing protein [bacterium]|nr:FG-GAP-like repeat-containing protein [bacterium]